MPGPASAAIFGKSVYILCAIKIKSLRSAPDSFDSRAVKGEKERTKAKKREEIPKVETRSGIDLFSASSFRCVRQEMGAHFFARFFFLHE